MRTLIVMPPGSRFDETRPTSIETVVRSMALHSRDRDDLTILCDEGGDRGDAFDTLTIREERAPIRRAGLVMDQIRRLKPDLVELQQHMPSAGILAARLRTTTTILYRHNMLPHAKGPFTRWRHHGRLRKFDGHIFVSEPARLEFADRYPDLAGRSVALTNAIDMEHWAAPVENRAPVIAFAGRAAPEKGLEPLCQALDIVLAARPDWRAELALGDWSTHQRWSEAQIARLAPFGDRVEILRDAPHARVRTLFQRAAIVVIPSLWREPFGLVAIESHAAGAAVISSGSGGLAQASGGHALIVPPEGADLADRLAAGMLTLIDDPARRETMARDGQAYTGTAHDAGDRSRQLDDLRRRFRDEARMRKG